MIPNEFSFSQSSLQSYLNCPRQFELLYLQKLAWPAQKYADAEKFDLDLAAGQSLHQAIQRYLLGFDESLILEGLQAGKDPRVPIWFTNFQTRLGYLKEKTDFIAEIPVSILFGQYWLTAKFDYLCLDNGHTHIFDWKTSAKKPGKTLLLESMQTKVYLTVAHQSEQGSAKTVPTISYWEANFPDLDLTIVPSERTLARAATDLNNLISEIAAQTEFPMTKTPQRCVYCKFRSYCNRGALPGEAILDEAFEQMVAEELGEVKSES